MARLRLPIACAAVLVACTPADRSYEIREVRERAGAAPRLGATSDERFRVSPGDAAPHGMRGPAAGGGLAWTAPAEWFEVAAGDRTLARFRVDAGVEAWISVLAGAGGGLAANVARWCEQYGREPLGPEALAALPRLPVLGRDAWLVDLTGDGDGRGMLGVICALGDRSVFVKLDGPSGAVRAHAAAFRAFCESLRVEE